MDDVDEFVVGDEWNLFDVFVNYCLGGVFGGGVCGDVYEVVGYEF